MDYRYGSHKVYNIEYHFVWVGIRLTRDSWNTTIVTQNAREGHPWWSWLQEPEGLKLQSVPPHADTRFFMPEVFDVDLGVHNADNRH